MSGASRKFNYIKCSIIISRFILVCIIIGSLSQCNKKHRIWFQWENVCLHINKYKPCIWRCWDLLRVRDRSTLIPSQWRVDLHLYTDLATPTAKRSGPSAFPASSIFPLGIRPRPQGMSLILSLSTYSLSALCSFPLSVGAWVILSFQERLMCSYMKAMMLRAAVDRSNSGLTEPDVFSWRLQESKKLSGTKQAAERKKVYKRSFHLNPLMQTFCSKRLQMLMIVEWDVIERRETRLNQMAVWWISCEMTSWFHPFRGLIDVKCPHSSVTGDSCHKQHHWAQARGKIGSNWNCRYDNTIE